jgi:anti-sigma B factor antagonist
VCGILRLSGRILSDEHLSEILRQVERTIVLGRKYWLCELSELTYCNSTGLNLFIRILTKSRGAGGDCALINLQPGVRSLFELSKLNEIFTSYASLDEALARYNTVS